MKVSEDAYGKVQLSECKNTEFVLELRGVSVKPGCHKQSCPFQRVSAKRASTAVTCFENHSHHQIQVTKGSKNDKPLCVISVRNNLSNELQLVFQSTAQL